MTGVQTCALPIYDGVTAVVDPYGRIAAQSPLYRQEILTARFSFLSDRTFYTVHGDVFAWSCVGLCVLIFLVAFIRRPAAVL